MPLADRECTTCLTHFLVMTSCERHAGANMALKNEIETVKFVLLCAFVYL